MEAGFAAQAPGQRVAILTATWQDFNTVRHLEKVCFPEDAWPFWDVIGVLALPNVVRLKAVVDEQLVGFIAADIRARDRTAWIATLGVMPGFRRQGIATALIGACEGKLTVPYVRLSVRASNIGAQRLYQSLGYRTIDRWQRYYQGGDDAVVMEKRLA